MSTAQAPFDPSLRVVPCARCAEAASGPAPRGPVRCPSCGEGGVLEPRRDEEDRRRAASPPAMDEGHRLQLLAAQGGAALQVPPHLRAVLASGGGPDALLSAWRQARQVATAGGDEAPLALIALAAAQQLSGQRPVLARALLEGALDALDEPKHRQLLLALLCRLAIADGRLDHARHWLSLCAPHLPDVHADTAWRFSAAAVATAEGRFEDVLRLLGEAPGAVPLDGASGMACDLLRANAHERLGRLDVAVRQLRDRFGNRPDQLRAVLQAQAHLRPCPRAAEEALRGDVAAGDGGDQEVVVTFRGITGAVPFLVMLMLLPVFFGLAVEEASLPPLVVLPVLGLVGAALLGLLVWHLLRTYRWRARARGRARILSVTTTGTEINHQPVLQFELLVTLPGGRSFRARHREVVAVHRIPVLQPGAELAVEVDPTEPRRMRFAKD